MHKAVRGCGLFYFFFFSGYVGRRRGGERVKKANHQEISFSAVSAGATKIVVGVGGG